MSWVSDEKAALVDTLRSADPQAPTLDEGWDVRRLLAHLVQREQGPLAAVVDAVSRRRAGPVPAEPRTLPEGQQQAVWRQLTLFALTLRPAPVGVRLATPTGTARVAKKGDGVTLTGEPVGLALYLSGRRPPARVAVTGNPDAITSFTGWVGAR